MSSRRRICEPESGVAYERPPECTDDIRRWGKHYWTGTADEKAFFRVVNARPSSSGLLQGKRFYLSQEHYRMAMRARTMRAAGVAEEGDPFNDLA